MSLKSRAAVFRKTKSKLTSTADKYKSSRKCISIQCVSLRKSNISGGILIKLPSFPNIYKINENPKSSAAQTENSSQCVFGRHACDESNCGANPNDRS